MLINFVDATNDANHYTKSPRARLDSSVKAIQLWCWQFLHKKLVAHFLREKCSLLANVEFTFTICHRPSVGLSVACRLKRSCTLLGRLKFSASFLCHLVPWPPIDIQENFLRRSSQGNPSVELNTRGVAEYSDFGPIKHYISETVQDRT